MNSRQPKIEKAFTLIELLVVIAIVGILAGLAVVNMSGATEAARIAKLKVYSNSIRSSLMGNRVSEWKFDEGTGTTTADTVGVNNGVLGSFNFNSVSGWRSGSDCVSGGCLQFDGVDDYVNAGSAANLNITDAFTIEAWIKTSNVNKSYQGIVRQGTTQNGIHFMFENSGGTVSGWSRLNGVWAGMAHSPALANNVWYHVVLVYNGASSVVYTNGIKGTPFVQSGTITGFDTSALMISQSPYGGSFIGLIDEVRIYNAALTASRIRESYLAGMEKIYANGQITQQDYQQRLADLDSIYATKE